MSSISATRHHLPARIVGLIVFAVGIALLISVFFTARALFNAPPTTFTAPTPTSTDPNAPSAAVEIGRSFGLLGRQILLLLLMCIAGSVTTSKGIQLYFAAHAPVEKAPTS